MAALVRKALSVLLWMPNRCMLSDGVWEAYSEPRSAGVRLMLWPVIRAAQAAAILPPPPGRFRLLWAVLAVGLVVLTAAVAMRVFSQHALEVFQGGFQFALHAYLVENLLEVLQAPLILLASWSNLRRTGPTLAALLTGPLAATAPCVATFTAFTAFLYAAHVAAQVILHLAIFQLQTDYICFSVASCWASFSALTLDRLITLILTFAALKIRVVNRRLSALPQMNGARPWAADAAVPSRVPWTPPWTSSWPPKPPAVISGALIASNKAPHPQARQQGAQIIMGRHRGRETETLPPPQPQPPSLPVLRQGALLGVVNRWEATMEQVSALLGHGMLGLPLLYSLLHVTIGLVTASSNAIRDTTVEQIRLLNLIRVAIYLSRVASLAITAGWLYGEAKETETIIGAMDTSLLSNGERQRIHQLLLLSRETEKLRVCGIVSIDQSFLFTVMGNTMTYLVMLLQYPILTPGKAAAALNKTEPKPTQPSA